MTVPDISTLTPAELVTLIQQANAKYAAAQAAAASDVQTRKSNVAAAITTLETLLGPTGATKGTTSIRAVRKYSQAEMSAAAGIALDLIFQALEQLTVSQLNLAHIIAADQR